MNNEEQINIWTERIESYKARKGSALAWSKENNVPLSTLRYWMDKIDNRQRDTSEPNEWIPVEVSNSTDTSYHKPSTSGIRIDIGSASILLSSEFDYKALESIVEILSKNAR